MSIDNCQVCDKRLDTDFIEYQEDGRLLCDSCLDGLPAQRAKELLREAMPDFMADSAAVVAVQNHIQRLTQAEIYKLDGEQE
jgi:hypothetical protein